MDCIKMIVVSHNGVRHKVPCGKCGFCTTNKRSSWMVRLYHEMRNQQVPGWFVTLTYNEASCPRTPERVRTLAFRHIQLYLKVLRKAKYYCKYICVGEYGSDTQRPHYHMILWTDAPAEKLQSLWKNKKGKVRGHVHVRRLNMATCMYTLKYIIQPKVTVNDPYGREKTRAQFSRGIGLSYLTSAVYDYHTADYDNPVMTTTIDGQTLALPRYYKLKIFTKYQLAKESFKFYWKNIKESRKEMRRLLRKGIKNTHQYRQALRRTQEERIRKNVKHNQTL